MVRLKTRWLLARIDCFAPVVSDNSESITPTRNEHARSIRDNLLQCFGVTAAGAAYETQGAC